MKMKTRMRLLSALAIVFAVCVVLGLGFVAYLAYEKQEETRLEPTYQIIMQDDYDVFVGDTFYLTPNLVTDRGEHAEGIFSFESDHEGVTVDQDGLVTVGPSASGEVHISIREYKTGVTAEILLRVTSDVYDVYELYKADGTAVNGTQSYLYGESYAYTVSTLPESTELGEYTVITCTAGDTAYPDAIAISVQGNRITITANAIGEGTVTVHIANERRGVDFTRMIAFNSAFADGALTKSVRSAHSEELIVRDALEDVTELVFDTSVTSLSLAEVSAYLPSVRRIVFSAQSVVNVTSALPQNIIYRVPQQAFKQYLASARWEAAKNDILPYIDDYHEVVVVYHTDEDHPAASFDEDGLLIQRYEGELLQAHSEGYTLAGWLNGAGNSVKDADMVGVSDGIHLYADWSTNGYTVTFEDYNPGEKKTITAGYLETVGSLSAVEPHKLGWQFVGWYFEETFETPFTEDTVYTATEGITVYAKYTTSISLHYDELKQEGEIDGVEEVVYNSMLTSLPAPAPREGWLFGGWYTTPSGYHGDSVGNGSAYALERADQTLYAQWRTEIAYEYDRSDFSLLDWAPYVYVRGLTIRESNEVTGESLRAQADFSGKYASSRWSLGGLFTVGGIEVTAKDEDIRFEAGDVICVDFVSQMYIQYLHDATGILMEKIHHGSSFALLREEWGTAAGTYSEYSTVYDRGYAFAYLWDEAAESVISEQNGTITIAFEHAHRFYTVKYTVVEYTISFAVEGTALEPIRYSDIDREGKVLPAFEGALAKKGYTGNWLYDNFIVVGRDKNGNWTGVWDVPVNLFGDITLKADYSLNNYRVTFIGYDGEPLQEDGEVYSPTVYFNTAIDASVLNYVRDKVARPNGYTFIGWFLESGEQWLSDRRYDFDEDISLYAKFEKTITFDMRMSATGAPEEFRQSGSTLTYVVRYGEELPFPMDLKSQNGAWSLVGWREDATVSPSVLSYEDGTPKTSIPAYTSTIATYYAIWEQDVTLAVPNGGNDIVPESETFTILYGAPSFAALCELYGVDPFADAFFVKSESAVAWSFAGWYLDSSFDGDPVDKNSNYTEQYGSYSDITIYAKFTATVAFEDATGDAILSRPFEVALGMHLKALLELAEREFTVPTGYGLGWSFGDREYQVSDIADDVLVPFELGGGTLRVNHIANTYTVVYDANGGEGRMGQDTFTYGESKALRGNLFTRTGYRFAGWKLGDETFEDKALVENLTAEAGGVVTLYAVWEPISYTVRYDANGGEGTMSEDTFIYDVPKTLQENRFERIGYQFAGWKLGDETFEDKAIVENLTAEAGAVVTLYAVWEAVTLNVKYQFDFGEYEDEYKDEVKYNETDVFLSVMRYGYRFIGWLGEDGRLYQAGEEFPNFIPDNEDNSIIFRAQWEIDEQPFYITYQDENGAVLGRAAYTLANWKLEGATYVIDKDEYASVFTVRLESQTHFSDIAIFKPALPLSRAEGYFYYWDLSGLKEALLGCLKGDQADISDFTVTLQYAPVPYTISFMLGGELVKTVIYTVEDLDENFRENLAANVPPVQEKTGYVFAGWDIDALFDEEGKVALGNHVVYAQFTANVYTLELYDETGSELLAKVEEFTLDDGTVTLPEGSLAYQLKNFFVWDLSAKNLTSTIEDLEAGESTIRIKGSLRAYVVKLVESGAIRELVFTYRNLIHEGNDYFFGLDVLSEEGYRFILGNYDYTNLEILEPTEPRISFEYKNIALIALSEGEMLYVFDANGGELFDRESGAYIGKTIMISEGTPQRFEGGEGVYFGGHTFECWEESAVGDAIVYMTAVWKSEEVVATELVTLQFETEAGLYQPADLVVESGKKVALPQVAKTGYLFDGWLYGGELYKTVFDTGLLTEEDGTEIVLVAQWSPITYTVVFDYGYDDKIIEETYFYEDEIDFSEKMDTSHANYDLNCWYDEISGKVYQINGVYSRLTAIHESTIVLKAHWSSDVLGGDIYYIIYINSSGQSILPNTEVQKNAEVIELRTPERAGYKFIQWYNDRNEAIAEYDFNSLFNNGESHICYLVERNGSWEILPYKIRFLNNDVELTRTVINQEVEIPEGLTAPVRLGYTVEWKVPDFNYCDVVVYPTYVPITYQIHYSAEGADLVPEAQEVHYDNLTATFVDAKWDGKVFVGWLFDGTVYPAGSLIPNLTVEAGEVTVVAVWRDYEIVFIDEDGTILLTVLKTDDVVNALLAGAVLPSGVQLPEREGYQLVWEAEEAEGDVTVRVRYVPVVFYLSYYDVSGEEVLLERITVSYGAEIAFASASKPGYKLLFWVDERGRAYHVGDRVDLFGESASEIRLEAVWQAITYFVEYDKNGGDLTPERVQVSYDNQEILFASIARTGYLFSGWQLGEDVYAAGERIPNLTETDGAVVLMKALWTAITYEIRYDVGCDDENVVLPEDVVTQAEYDGELFLLPVLSGRAGYEFVGWECKGFSFTDGALELAVNNLSYEQGDIVVLHAIWKVITYTIEYYWSQGDDTPYVKLEWTVETGAFVEPQLSGLFAWSKYADRYDAYVLEPASFSEEGVLKVYRVSTNSMRTIYVVYRIGETTISERVTLTVAEIYSITLADVPHRTGYFGEWSAVGDVQIDDGNTITVVDTGENFFTVSVEAVYTPIEYTVVFVSAGGTWEGEGGEEPFTLENVKYDETIETPLVRRIGYEFVGWRYSNSTEKFDDTLINLTAIHGDTVLLVAIWAPVTYTVEFYSRTGEEKVTYTCVYGEDIALSAEFTRTGYILSGWDLYVDGRTTIDFAFTFGEIVSNLPMKLAEIIPDLRLTGVISLLAHWTPITYTVQYVSDGEVVAESEISYDDEIPVGPALYKAGYEVVYWSEEELGEALDYTCPLTSEQGAIARVYAVWKAIEYTVIYDAGEGTPSEAYRIVVYGNTEVRFATAMRQGYDFVGWEYAGEVYPADMVIPDLSIERGEVIVHAVWKASVYTVYFLNTYGEIIKVATYTIEDETIEYPALPEGCVAWKFEAEDEFTFIASPVPQTAYVTFYTSNKEVIAVRDVTGMTEEEIKALVPVPAKAGYEGAWSLEEERVGEKINYVATPVYEAIVYSITFVDWDGNYFGEAAYTVENYDFESPAVPAYLCRHNDATHADRYITHWEEVHLTYGDITIRPVAEAKVYYIEFRYFLTPDNYYAGLYEVFFAVYTDEYDFKVPNILYLDVDSDGESWLDALEREFTDDNAATMLSFDTDKVDIFTAYYSTGSYYVEYVYRFKDWNDNIEEHSLGEAYIRFGITVDAVTPEDFSEVVPTGYYFNRWYVLVDGTELEVVFGAAGEGQISINMLSDRLPSEEEPFKLYTEFVPYTYTIVVDVDGGTPVAVQSFDVSYADIVKAMETTTRTGYTFIEWQANLDGYIFTVAANGKVGEALRNLPAEYVPNDGETIRLTAQWKANDYTVRYDSNHDGVNGSMAESEFTYDQSGKLRANAFSKSDLYFLGWHTDKNATEPLYADGATVSNLTDRGTITLYAIWEQMYKVKQIDSGGTFKSGVTNGGYYRSGTSITFSVSFDHSNSRDVIIDGSSKGEKDSYTFTMPPRNIEIEIISKKSCIASGSMIMLANGRSTAVENLAFGDEVLVFNHETGTFDVSVIAYIEHDGFDYYETLTLYFEGGVSVKVMSEHGFFDTDLREYVMISLENAGDFVGHTFFHTEYVNGENVIQRLKLIGYKIETEYLDTYSFVTATHLNHFVNGMLGMAAGIEGLYNIFELDENFKYDEEKMAADIEQYGLYTYEDFAEYIPYEVYLAFPAAYFKVSVGKGHVTFEDIVGYIYKYLI